MDYRDISVSALCRKMNVQRKTFYRYFDGIEDVLDAVIDEMIQDAFLLLQDEPEIEEFFEFWRNKKSFLDVLEKYHLSGQLLNRACERSFLLTGEGVSIRGLCWMSYVAAHISMVIAWHHGGMRQNIDELVAMVKSIYNFAK